VTSRDPETTAPRDHGATRPRRRAGSLAAALDPPPAPAPEPAPAAPAADEQPAADAPPAAPQTTIRFDLRERLALGRLQLHAMAVLGGRRVDLAELVRAAVLLVDDDPTLRDQLIGQLQPRTRGTTKE
jgi:hypothetical protein